MLTRNILFSLAGWGSREWFWLFFKLTSLFIWVLGIKVRTLPGAKHAPYHWVTPEWPNTRFSFALLCCLSSSSLVQFSFSALLISPLTLDNFSIPAAKGYSAIWLGPASFAVIRNGRPTLGSSAWCGGPTAICPPFPPLCVFFLNYFYFFAGVESWICLC